MEEQSRSHAESADQLSQEKDEMNNKIKQLNKGMPGFHYYCHDVCYHWSYKYFN